MLYHYSEKMCLNGWWDFYPVYPGSDMPPLPPREGFEEQKLLVPSHWNKPRQAVRMPGESTFHSVPENTPGLYDGEAEWLLDVYGYPIEWSRAKAGYICRTLNVEKKPGKRYFIVMEAVGPKATVFVNDIPGETRRENLLPLVMDVTDSLVSGENRLAVRIEDYERIENRQILWPFGLSNYPGMGYGLMNDAWLVEKDEVYFGDITIRTSYRENRIEAFGTVRNASDAGFEGELTYRVTGMDGEIAITGTAGRISLAAGEKGEFALESSWTDPKLWEPEAPNLYWLEVSLLADGRTIGAEKERFGFREVWIEGKELMMNGHPIHLFSDWGHRATPHPHTRAWVQKWFGMMRDMNLNHSRLHTGPHPEMILDMADEQGILITDETGIFGSGGEQASCEQIYWERAFEHIRRFVRRDKNHPCMILWCVENEMRWNSDKNPGGSLTLKYLPEIRKEFNRLDPTRPAYHEGDSSCWNEAEQALVSRHYGKECSGLGWWDKKQPLHCGEMGLYHYSGPNNTVQFGGDRVWLDMSHVNRYAVKETEELVVDGRVNGICAIGPWNFSGLLNYRHHPYIRFEYEDYTAPGLKPAFANACTSEFRYWEEGPGYDFAPGTEEVPKVFRPFAALMWARRTSFYTGDPVVREICMVNDLPRDVEATAAAELRWAGGGMKCEKPVSVKRGCSQMIPFEFDLRDAQVSGKCELTVTVTEGNAVLDQWTCDLFMESVEKQSWPGKVYVYGDGSAEKQLKALGADIVRVESIQEAEKGGVLVIERNAIRFGSTANEELAAFCAAGGRAILMEQRVSAFPGIEAVERPYLRAFVRAENHPALEKISEGMLQYWGDAPYSLLSGDAYVSNWYYRKDSGERIRTLVDTGEGNFGDGDLESVLVMEVEEGEGLIIASQMNVTSRFFAVPAAARVLEGMLMRAFGYRKSESRPELIAAAEGEALAAQLERVKAGETMLALRPDEAMLAAISAAAGVLLETVREKDGTFSCIKTGAVPELNGVNHADLSGIEKYNYSQRGENKRVADRVLKMADGLIPAVVTTNKGVLREMYVYGGASEILRAYTQSIAGETEEYVVIGRVKLGEGTIVISMFEPENPDNARLHRVENMLRRNLFGTVLGESPLQGEIAGDSDGGDGVPKQVYRMFAGDRFEMETNILEQCHYQNERMNARPLLEDKRFAAVAAETGTFEGEAGVQVLYYTVEAKTPRKLTENDLALPDPMARTHLDLTGTGEACVWINGERVGEVKLTGDTVTVPEIDMECGYNHILIVWRCEEKGAQLHMQWRNIMHEPERSFVFQ